jgi:hypothetical protein
MSDKKYRSYEAVAKAKGWPFELTKEEFDAILERSCFYCGGKGSMGLDRIESEAGFTVANVVPCCEKCAYIKRNRATSEFLTHIEKIYKYREILS